MNEYSLLGLLVFYYTSSQKSKSAGENNEVVGKKGNPQGNQYLDGKIRGRQKE